ncbi:ubiquinol-cytochrome-c reductase cytochrome c1 [Phlyctema vagabunda]|uniref:Ubiquinol-cytochrome-c reductase cytochrome c1 n=1 Tax=Phlyctema vagabunda TaxID=108571 RepID=A0ABR4P638_9HELO
MMEDIIQKEGWDCPESVELNIWARVFRHNEDKFDAEKLIELGKPFPELLDSIAQLRHTAVHRVRVSANTVYQFLTEAEALANMLYDNTCARMLSRLRREAKQVIDELGRNKDLLKSILKEKLQEVDARRRELDRLECKAVEDMLKEDKEYQALVSVNLEQAISAPEILQYSTSLSEHDTSSEAEVEVESSGRLSFGQIGENLSSNSKLADII